LTHLMHGKCIILPVPLAVRSEAWVCGRWHAEIVISNSAGGMDVCLFVAGVVRCQVENSVTNWSPVQGSPTECGASLFAI